MKNILPILIFATAFTASAQTVTLDETFVVGASAGITFNVFAVEKLTDGKLMIAGNFDHYNGSPARGIARVNPDGSIDDTFTSQFGDNLVTDFVVEEDGKVMVVGEYYGISRLNADGSIDTSFNANLGIMVSSIIKQGDKYIVSGNFERYAANERLYKNLVRLNNDGSVDGTFPATSLDSQYASILQQEDGKLLLTGTIYYYNDLEVNGIVRLNADGSFDETFNTGTGSDGWIRGTAQQPDGKYVLTGGFMNFNGHPAKTMVRLNNDGSIDETFAFTSTGIGLPEDGIVGFDVAVQEDGKILVGGQFLDSMQDIEGTPDGSIPVHLVRLNADGSNDTSFTLGEGFNDTVYALEFKEGMGVTTGLYVGGQFTQFNGVNQTNLALLREEVLGNESYTVQGVAVYPNPVEDRLFVSISQNAFTGNVRLTDATGKVVKATQPVGYDGIDVSGLAKGIYFAEITIGDTSEVKKIIKQ